MEIGPFIKLHRMKQNMTQEQLAAGIVSESYLSKIENEKTIANHEIINMLCMRLGIHWNNDQDAEIKEKSRKWYERLSVKSDKARLKSDYEELQQLVSNSYSDVQVMFEIYKIRYFIVMKDFEQALDQIQSLKELAGSFDAVQQYYWLKFCGNYYFKTENFNQALHLYKSAEEKAGIIDISEEEMAGIKYMLGAVYSKLHHKLKVIEYANQALDVYQKQYNFHCCTHTHILLAASYRSMKVYSEAIKNYSQALRLAVLNQEQELVNHININLGHLYSTIGDSEEAIKIFSKVLEENGRTLTDEDLFNAISSLAREYFRIDDYEKAREKAEEGLKLLEEKDGGQLWIYRYGLKAYVCFSENETKEFEHLIVGEFIPFLQKQKDHSNFIFYCHMAGSYFESFYKYKKAVKYYKLANITYEELLRN